MSIKNIEICLLLVLSVFVAGCGKVTTDGTNTTGSTTVVEKVSSGEVYKTIPSCQEYIELTKCVIKNSSMTGVSISSSSEKLDMIIDSWKNLDKSVLTSACDQILKAVTEDKTYLQEAGCVKK